MGPIGTCRVKEKLVIKLKYYLSDGAILGSFLNPMLEKNVSSCLTLVLALLLMLIFSPDWPLPISPDSAPPQIAPSHSCLMTKADPDPSPTLHSKTEPNTPTPGPGYPTPASGRKSPAPHLP